MKILNILANLVMNKIKKYDLNLSIKKLGVGTHFSIIILNDGSTGLCHLPNLTNQCCLQTIYEDDPYNRLNIDNTNLLKDKNPINLINLYSSKDLVKKSLAISCINAISSHILTHFDYKLNYDQKEIAGLIIPKNSVIGMIGAIRPIINSIYQKVDKIYLKEFDINKIPKNIKNVITVNNLEFIKDVDILIITGSTIINESIDEILKYIDNCNESILIGPSAGFLPEPFFEKGITRIASMLIIEPNKVFEIITKGGGTPHFKKFGKKYYLKNDNN